MELICPAGTPSALREAVGAGADAVYCGFRDETNARNFPGLNFSRDELREAIASYDTDAINSILFATMPEFSPLQQDDHVSSAKVLAFPAREANRF